MLFFHSYTFDFSTTDDIWLHQGQDQNKLTRSQTPVALPGLLELHVYQNRGM